MTEEEKNEFVRREDDPEYIDRLLSLIKESVDVYNAAEKTDREKKEPLAENRTPAPEKGKPSPEEKTTANQEEPSRFPGEVTAAPEEKNTPDTAAAVSTFSAERTASADGIPDGVEEASPPPLSSEDAPFAVRPEDLPADVSAQRTVSAGRPAEPAQKKPVAEEPAARPAPGRSEPEEPASRPAPQQEEKKETAGSEPPRRHETGEWEAITLDGELEQLIAESRERRLERPGGSRSGLSSRPSGSSEKSAKEGSPDARTRKEEPAVSDRAATQTSGLGVSSGKATGPSSSPSGAPASALPSHRTRRFRARLLRRASSPAEKPAGRIKDTGRAVPLTDTPRQEKIPEEINPVLRPQDFFIADMRENETTTVSTDEFVSRNQIETIYTRYAGENRKTRIAFFASVFLACVLLVFENLPLFGVSYGLAFGLGAAGAVLIDAGLLAAVLLLVPETLAAGARALLVPRLEKEALLPVLSFFSFVGILWNLIAGTAILCALPCVVFVSLLLGFRLSELRNETRTFSHLCASGDKLAAEDLPAVYAVEETAALGKRVRDVMRIKKVGFVGGFFARLRRRIDDYPLHMILLPLAALISFLSTILYAIIAGATSAEVLSFFASLILSSYTAVFFATRGFAYRNLVRGADELGTAVVGESSAEEYARVNAISFEDVEAYPSRRVRVRQIKIYENAKLDEILYYMASVFSILGGPLDGVFRVSASELGLSEDVRLTASHEDGFEAEVDGVTILAGKSTFFPKDKIYAYYDGDYAFEEDCGNISVMYVSLDGVISAKFCIEYTISRKFEHDALRLRRAGVSALVRSYDPNISNLLLVRTLRTPGLTIRAVRKKTEQLYDFAESRIDSGLVSTTGSKDLLHTLFLCQNYRRSAGTGRVIKTLSVFLSLLAGALIFASVGRFYSVYTAALQLFWLLPSYIAAKIHFRKGQGKK